MNMHGAVIWKVIHHLDRCLDSMLTMFPDSILLLLNPTVKVMPANLCQYHPVVGLV